MGMVNNVMGMAGVASCQGHGRIGPQKSFRRLYDGRGSISQVQKSVLSLNAIIVGMRWIWIVLKKDTPSKIICPGLNMGIWKIEIGFFKTFFKILVETFIF